MIRFFLLFTIFFTLTFAQNKAMIIFDASGSMWGQIGGKAKITIAKDALKSVVKGWNENTELGVMAYGHRRKGDCNDIETLVPIDKVDKAKIINAVMGISPKGKTPISRSLKKAADELKFTEDKATVILISDGKETCDKDPCGTAKELKKQGIDFVAHVIGFNVDKATDKELACIAKATGGEYFSAKNAKELNSAVKEVAKKTQKPTPPPKPKVIKKNLEISASESEGSKWVRASHKIYKANNLEDNIDSCISYKNEPCLLSLPEGEYVVVSTYNQFKVKNKIKLTTTKKSKLQVIMGQTGTVIITAKENGKRVQATFRFFKDNKRVDACTTYEGKDCKVKMPAGEYIMQKDYEYETYEYYKSKDTKVTLNPSENKKLEVNFNALYLSSSGINPCIRVNYEILKPTGESVASKRAMAKDSVKFVLDSGEYFIEATAGDKKVKHKLTLESGKQIDIDFGGKSDAPNLNAIWNISGLDSEVKLYQDGTKIKGTYPSDNGKIIGELTYPQRFDGYWIEGGSNKKCATKKEGSYYWGRLIMIFDKDKCQAKSSWSYCNEAPKKEDSFNSKYINSLPKQESKEELIKADSPNATNSAKSELEEIKKAQEMPKITKDEAKELEERLKRAKDIVNMAAKMVGKDTKEQQIKTDKKFEELSKDLEMFSK